MSRAFLALLFFCVCFCAASGKADKDERVAGTGTVRYQSVEGGFYGIVTDGGRKYDPMNLAAEFRVDGLRVRFEAKLRPDVRTTRMFGTVIEITKIQKLPAPTD